MMTMMNRIRQLPPVFWIGLLPVVLLLGAWAISRSYHVGWYYNTGFLQHGILLENSRVNFLRTEAAVAPGELADNDKGTLMPRTGSLGEIRSGTYSRLRPDIPLFPAPYFKWSSSSSGPIRFDHRLWSVPPWLIVLGYLPLWLGISWWQAGRRRKKIEAELPRELEPQG